MTKSDLVRRIAHRQSLLAGREVELAVKVMLEHMTACLAAGGRIEVRGFGSFFLRFRRGRVGRNPSTATPVALPSKYVPLFKPGKALRERVDRLAREARGDLDGKE
ncbi:MAG: integration host factor subunit beta [Chromatiales bacterium]|nr:integration host factor subunit beta [Chromatiales bacterium]